MKNIFLILIGSFIIISTGCSDFVEGYDESPNNPAEVAMAQILTASELGLQTAYTSGISRIAPVLTQQMAGTDQQCLDWAYYSFEEGANTNEWNTMYNDAVQPANDIIQKAGDENPYYKGMAGVIKAMALAIATDTWGDVPAREAGLGLITGNLTPKFEPQEQVYEYIQELLNTALQEFSKPEEENLFLPGEDDFFFEGDLEKWENLVYMLQARYANRLSKKDAQGSANQALAALANVTAKGDLIAKYGSPYSDNNQWYWFFLYRDTYMRMGELFINLLTSKQDPRLPFYADENEDGNYVGSPANDPDQEASILGPYINGPIAPIPIVTHVEALFIKAEANLRLNQNAEAAEAYNEAVKLSVLNVTGESASAEYVAAEASETGATITLEKIMTQKYLALFLNTEAWADWRRTGFPTLIPNDQGAVSGIPRRLPTVVDERLYNPNAIVVHDILQPVWWDE